MLSPLDEALWYGTENFSLQTAVRLVTLTVQSDLIILAEAVICSVINRCLSQYSFTFHMLENVVHPRELQHPLWEPLCWEMPAFVYRLLL